MIPYSRRTNLCCRTKYIVKGKICFVKKNGLGPFKIELDPLFTKLDNWNYWIKIIFF